MRLWFECWGYNSYIKSSYYMKDTDYGILRLSHDSHADGKHATMELQHQSGICWFDRSYDTIKLQSGDVIVGLSGHASGGNYKNPTFVVVHRIDERRVRFEYLQDYFPNWITELNQDEIRWIVDDMIAGKPVGLPRTDHAPDHDMNMPGEAYSTSSALDKGFGVCLLDARKSATPWQPAYMRKVVNKETELFLAAIDNTPEGERTAVWYVASGIELLDRRSRVIQQLMRETNKFLEEYRDTFPTMKIDYHLWSSYEFAHNVRAFPKLMAYIVDKILAKSNRKSVIGAESQEKISEI